MMMCPKCKNYLEQMEDTVKILGQMPRDTAVPDDLKQELLTHFKDWKSSDSVE